jgi:hypothetical protein
MTWLIPVAGLAAALYALWLARDVLSRDAGTAEMQEIGGMIFEGAMAFLSRQYRTIAIFALLTAVLIGGIVGAVSEGVKEIINDGGEITYGDVVIGRWEEGLMTGIAFLVGAICSGLAGYIGMYISVRSKRLEHLRRLQQHPRQSANDRSVPHRRLRFRCELRGALRPARRRHLHEGCRRRRRPRR